jgi:uncharacterized membrane protein YagU involved in acid resistance
VSVVLHATFRGVVAAMAMTGVRVFAVHAELIDEDPPSRMVRRQARGLVKAVPRRQRRAVIELVHWGFGAVFGALFGLLPDEVRRSRWAGPVYGFAVWLGFEAAAPVLGLRRGGWPDGRERAVFVADHLLYGLVLSEFRKRPRE